MTAVVALPQGRIPIGYVTVQGQRIPVEIEQQWMLALSGILDRVGGVMGNDDQGVDVFSETTGNDSDRSVDLSVTQPVEVQEYQEITTQPAFFEPFIPDVAQPQSITAGDVSGLAAAITAGAPAETATTIAAIDHAATVKATPVDADEVSYLNSATSFSLVRSTWTNIKAFLKTYFDTLYLSAMPAGTVLQVVTFTSNAAFTTSLASDVATALTATITPKSASSRVHVVITANLRATSPGAGNNCYVQPKLYRGASPIWDGFAQVGNFGSSDVRGFGGVSYVDSPASTTATAYTLYLNSTYAAGVYMNNGGGTSTITLIEIAG